MREGHAFLVGQMAHAYPSVVRRIYNEGHTIGSHSQDHPRAFERLSVQRVEREVDGGIYSVTVALGDAKALSPFFRLPGFGRTNAIERFLENKQLVTWSANGYDVVHVVAAGERPKSVPELMALPTTDGTVSPTVLTSVPRGDHAHRIKKRGANRHRPANS